MTWHIYTDLYKIYLLGRFEENTDN